MDEAEFIIKWLIVDLNGAGTIWKKEFNFDYATKGIGDDLVVRIPLNMNRKI